MNVVCWVGESPGSQFDVCLRKVSSSRGSTILIQIFKAYHLEALLQSWEAKTHPLQDEATEN